MGHLACRVTGHVAGQPVGRCSGRCSGRCRGRYSDWYRGCYTGRVTGNPRQPRHIGWRRPIKRPGRRRRDIVVGQPRRCRAGQGCRLPPRGQRRMNLRHGRGGRGGGVRPQQRGGVGGACGVGGTGGAGGAGGAEARAQPSRQQQHTGSAGARRHPRAVRGNGAGPLRAQPGVQQDHWHSPGPHRRQGPAWDGTGMVAQHGEMLPRPRGGLRGRRIPQKVDLWGEVQDQARRRRRKANSPRPAASKAQAWGSGTAAVMAIRLPSSSSR